MEKKLDVGAGTGIGVGVAAALINRLVNAAHAALHVVVPAASAFDTAVDFEDQAVLLNCDSGDLDLIAYASCGAVLLPDLRPEILVVTAIDIEIERLFRPRQVVLDCGKFGVETPEEFNALLLGKIGRG
jgi:hypothetical protein